MQAFYLFRFKVIESAQTHLFETRLDRQSFIRKLIKQKPSTELRNGYEWHIGNLHEIGEEALFFAIGRITKASQEKFDEKSGNFWEVHDEVAPFTYAILDLKMSILGIAIKTKLSQKVSGIAHSLEKLLNSQQITKEGEVRIEIAEIPDPESFIEQMDAAYAVVEFTVEFSGPNPFDVDADFHRPMEKYLAATEGEKGLTRISGQALEKKQLEKMARSIASTGNQASAKIKKHKESKAITRKMKGNAVVIQSEPVDNRNKAIALLNMIRNAYMQIRKHDEND